MANLYVAGISPLQVTWVGNIAVWNKESLDVGGGINQEVNTIAVDSIAMFMGCANHYKRTVEGLPNGWH